MIQPLLGFLSNTFSNPFLALSLLGKTAKLLMYLYIVRIPNFRKGLQPAVYSM